MPNCPSHNVIFLVYYSSYLNIQHYSHLIGFFSLSFLRLEVNHAHSAAKVQKKRNIHK